MAHPKRAIDFVENLAPDQGGEPGSPCARPQLENYRWRTEFGGLKLDQVKRLKELERENARLRKAVSDLTLEKVILKEAVSGNVWSAPPQQGSSW